ncbi:MAG: hypothetical protein M1824_003789 [Vezdaea acicularis]|nr:MAG: hypothetical protein M1824_003789 [Vezdaea acicularis]
MSAKTVAGPGGKKPASAATNLIAGGGAGMMEALACHPLGELPFRNIVIQHTDEPKDTIKVRMQLSRRGRAPGTKKRGFIDTGLEISRKETPLALYKGLGAVTTGIVPKMAIRFTSFEWYKGLGADKDGNVSGRATFLAGLAAGVTEAVAVVTPMEVVKIRLQAQFHSMSDPLDIPKYRNAAHAAYTVVKEEGIGALYRGVSLTALRQGSNQAVNFYAYTEFKAALQNFQPLYHDKELPAYQTMVCGLISGAMGPLSNAPIDTISTYLLDNLAMISLTRIETRLQRTPAEPGETALTRVVNIAKNMFKQEGAKAFYKGITPRVMRVAPGQAITFTVYEFLKEKLEAAKATIQGGKFEE